MNVVQRGFAAGDLPAQQHHKKVDLTTIKTQLFAVWFFSSLIAFAVASAELATGTSLLVGAFCLLSYCSKKGEEEVPHRAHRAQLRYLAAGATPAAGLSSSLHAIGPFTQPQPTYMAAAPRAPVGRDDLEPNRVYPIRSSGDEVKSSTEQKGGGARARLPSEAKGASRFHESTESKGDPIPTGRERSAKQARQPMSYARVAARNVQTHRGRGRGL